MGHKHSRELLLSAALDVAQRDGLHRVTYGRVATEAGVSDRIVVYYFPNKDALVTAVLETVGDLLQAGLSAAIADQRPRTHQQLVRLLWPTLSAQASQPVAALYVEALGLAAAGVAPYDVLAPAIATGWEDWLVDQLRGDRDRRRAEAAAALALVDGLLMVLLAAGPETAGRAATVLGVTGS